jgi:molecular chaperone DnaK
MSRLIGIDLGTTNSVVAILEKGEARIVQNERLKDSTPSVYAVKKKKGGGTEDLIGEAAKNQVAINAVNTIHGVKRLMGRKFNEPEVQEMIKLAGFKIVAAPNGDAHVEINGQVMSPVEVSAKYLIEMKRVAEMYSGEPVTDAVITVPAYFGDAQREATRQAGEVAGLKVLRIINEPTAAAFAFGIDKQQQGNFAVYSWGGGTFDVSILKIKKIKDKTSGKENTLFEVLASDGDTFLGGENLDEAVAHHLIAQFNKENDNALDISTPEARKANADAIQKFKEAAEKAKIELSNTESSTINIPFVMLQDGAPLTFEYDLTRGAFERLIKPFIEKTEGPFKNAMKMAAEKEQVDKIELTDTLMMGGTSRIPAVQAFVETLIGRKPNNSAHPKNSVAQGACIQAAILTGAPINGHEGRVILADVTPLSLGIRSKGDVMSKIIPRNTAIPATQEEIFETAAFGQKDVEIVVYQGERELVKDNRKIGEFLVKLPPGTPAKTPVAIKMSLDANGELFVTAKVAGVDRTVKMNPATGLSDAQIEEMIKRAEENKAADEEIRTRRVAEAQADDMLRVAVEEDTKEDWFTSAPADLKTAFDSAVKGLTEVRAQKPTVVSDLKTAITALDDVRNKMGQAFTSAAQPGGETTAAATEETPVPPTQSPGAGAPATP